MSTATKETEAPGLRNEPDELEFTPWTGHALLSAVTDAIQQRRRLDGDTDADRFVGAIKRGAHRLERWRREAGVDTLEDVLRPALKELEQARGILGQAEDTGEMLAAAGIEIHSPLGDHFWAARDLLDWALAGCRQRLAELDDAA